MRMSKLDRVEKRIKYLEKQQGYYLSFKKQLDLIKDLPGNTPWPEAEKILKERLSRPNYEETIQ